MGAKAFDIVSMCLISFCFANEISLEDPLERKGHGRDVQDFDPSQICESDPKQTFWFLWNFFDTKPKETAWNHNNKKQNEMKFNKYFRLLEEISTINFTQLYHCSLQVVFYLLSLQLFVVTSLVFGRARDATWLRLFFC